ncbi:MAG: hypothetical protein SGJ18_07545 [Pseudomonadota bacterium]|nr:hypothetical protein [Pseudomonadota bacterium]
MKLVVLKHIKYTLLLFALLSFIKPPGGVQMFGTSFALAAEEDYNEAPVNTPKPEDDPIVVKQPYPGPADPPTDVQPTPEPIKYRCDILLDKTGLYLNMFNAKYIAISNVTECMLNEANGIQGSCDHEKLITVIKNEQIRSIGELSVPQGSLVTIIEESDPSFFLCFSWTRGLILKIANSKVVMINPAQKSSTGRFGF